MIKKPRILGIGVATMDIYVNQNRMYPGGNEYNIACYAVKCGAVGGFMGVFSNDTAGRLLEETLESVGVDCSMSHHEKGSSGYSLVELLEDGDRKFLYWNQQGVTDVYPISFTDEEMDYVKNFDIVCLGRCASVSYDNIRMLSDKGIKLCYDFHATYDRKTIDEMAPYINFAFFSCSHLSEEETKEYLRYAVDKGASIAVGTRGAEKLFAYDGEEFYDMLPHKVKAIDALGAGDSFIASFLTEYTKCTYENADMDSTTKINRSLAAAAEFSAKIVQIRGSIGISYELDASRLEEVINL